MTRTWIGQPVKTYKVASVALAADAVTLTESPAGTYTANAPAGWNVFLVVGGVWTQLTTSTGIFRVGPASVGPVNN